MKWKEWCYITQPCRWQGVLVLHHTALPVTRCVGATSHSLAGNKVCWCYITALPVTRSLGFVGATSHSLSDMIFRVCWCHITAFPVTLSLGCVYATSHSIAMTRSLGCVGAIHHTALSVTRSLGCIGAASHSLVGDTIFRMCWCYITQPFRWHGVLVAASLRAPVSCGAV